MAEKVRMEFHDEGFREIVQNDNTHALIEQLASEIANKANSLQKIGREEGYKYSVFQASRSAKYPTGRWLGYVNAFNKLGRIDNRKYKTLSKAVHG